MGFGLPLPESFDARRGGLETFSFFSHSPHSTSEHNNFLPLLQVATNIEFYTEDMDKFKMSAGLVQDFRAFKIQVTNRREKIDARQLEYQPVFEKEIWKLNSEGDALKEDDW